MSTFGMFLWGAVGGSLPTLGKIAGTFGTNFDAPLPNVVGVAVAIVLYSFIGGVVSRAVGNPDVKQALFAGIAAPAIVVSVLAGASDSKSIQPPSPGAAPQQRTEFISSAHAQQVDPRQPTTFRTLTLETQTRSNYPVSGDIGVAATSPNQPTSTLGVIRPTPGVQSTTIRIPNDATQLTFTGSNGQVIHVPISSQNNKVKVEVDPQTKIGSDLLWALGSKRELGIGRIDAQPQM